MKSLSLIETFDSYVIIYIGRLTQLIKMLAMYLQYIVLDFVVRYFIYDYKNLSSLIQGLNILFTNTRI